MSAPFNVSLFTNATSLDDIKDALVAFFNTMWPIVAQSLSFSIGSGTSVLDPLNLNGSVNGSYGDCSWSGGWTCATVNLSTISGLKNITTTAEAVNDPYIQNCNNSILLLGSIGGTLNSLNLDANVGCQVLGLGGSFGIGVGLNATYATISWRVPCVETSPGIWTIQFSQSQLGVNLSLNGISGINGFPSWANTVIDPVINLMLYLLNATITNAIQGVLGNKFSELVQTNVPDVGGIPATALVCDFPEFVPPDEFEALTFVATVPPKPSESSHTLLVALIVVASLLLLFGVFR